MAGVYLAKLFETRVSAELVQFRKSCQVQVLHKKQKIDFFICPSSVQAVKTCVDKVNIKLTENVSVHTVGLSVTANLLVMKSVVSMNLSTQLYRQVSSLRKTVKMENSLMLV